MVGLTGDDLAEARRLWAYQRGLGLPVTPLRPSRAARARAGAGAAGARRRARRRPTTRSTRGGWSPALRAAAERAGATLMPGAVSRLSDVDAGVTVVAAGCGAAALTGLPVRPVKGQVLRLRAPGAARRASGT